MQDDWTMLSWREIDTLRKTNISLPKTLLKMMIFLFPKVGCVSSLEGILRNLFFFDSHSGSYFGIIHQ